jgi:hypothetical protein
MCFNYFIQFQYVQLFILFASALKMYNFFHLIVFLIILSIYTHIKEMKNIVQPIGYKGGEYSPFFFNLISCYVLS